MADYPTPEAGLVIRYSYLWHREHEQGRIEGAKDRPSCIVLSKRDIPGSEQVVIVPITHTDPMDESISVEIPEKVRRHLGLDGERSWVIVSEVNIFKWPGPDLRANESGEYSYGYLPPKLYDEIKEKLLSNNAGKAAMVVRS